MKVLAIALGGALGSVLRVWLSTSVYNRYPSNFPWGTISVNAIGSFLIGLLFIVIQQRFDDNEILRGFIIVGMLGGFTTFSTFSLETLLLLETGFWVKALANILASVSICVFSAFVGMGIGRWAT
jgi:CrcB protein